VSHAFKYIRLESYEDGAVLIERFQALEHPVIDVFKRVLEADQDHPEHRSLAVRVADSVLDRSGHKQPEQLEIESDQTIDVGTLSTNLPRQIAAELRQQEERGRAPSKPGRPAHDLRIDPSAAIAELAKREHDKFEHYFPNCRLGCVVDSTTFADHLNENGSQRFCRILHQKHLAKSGRHTPLLSRAHQKQLAFFRLGALYPELTHPGM
jgi:hypothetical protein